MPSPQYRNPPAMAVSLQHPVLQRRQMLQAGGIALLGLGLSHLEGLRAAAPGGARGRQRSAIFVFLSGGLGQHDSFDMKPDAPLEIRGEFSPIPTRTPGVSICEHLPLLANRSDQWALVRSLTHPYNEHSLGHHVMLTGRTPAPPGFNDSKPRPSDFPCIASVVTGVVPPRNNLPSSVPCPR